MSNTTNTNMNGSDGYFEARAQRDHRPIHPSQLPFKKGDIIYVTQTSPTGWFRGILNSKEGVFPGSYIQRIDVEKNNSDSYDDSQINSTSTVTATTTTTTTITPTIIVVEQNTTKPVPPIVPPRSSSSYSPATTEQPQQQATPIIPTLSVNSQQQPNGNINLSPRFNISKEALQSSISSLNTNNYRAGNQQGGGKKTNTITENNDNDQEGIKKYHSRKNSGPSTYISHGDQNDENDITSGRNRSTTVNMRNTSIDNNGQKPQLKLNSSSGDIGVNPQLYPIEENESKPPSYNQQQQQPPQQQKDKFKTLPVNHGKVNRPIIPTIPKIAEQHDNNNSSNNNNKIQQNNNNSSGNNQQRSRTTRITVDQVNTDVPYYITRCTLPYEKQTYDELSLKVGDLVVVFNSNIIVSDWWVGKLGNSFGVFPKKCVDIIKDIGPDSSSPIGKLNQHHKESQPNNNLVHNDTDHHHHEQQQRVIEREEVVDNNQQQNNSADDISKKIEQSLSHLETKEELLEAIKTLAVKFITRTNDLKKELDQERTLRIAFEKELLKINSQNKLH